jgi:ketosteroid isomerase-like protein
MKSQRVQMIIVVLLGMAFIGVLLTACTPREKPLPNDVVTALQSRYNANDPNGAANLFTDDGVIMTEFGESIRGKAAIQEFLRVELDKRLQYWVTSEGNTTVGNSGYDFGTMRIRDTLQGQDLENAKYMTLYRKDGGSWKIYRTIYNSNSLSVCTSVQVVPADIDGAAKTP